MLRSMPYQQVFSVESACTTWNITSEGSRSMILLVSPQMLRSREDLLAAIDVAGMNSLPLCRFADPACTCVPARTPRR